jgi:hypothetical protein
MSTTRTIVVVEEVVIVPYGKHAGKTKFAASVPRDRFGNAKGPEYDLSPDNVFNGQTVGILMLFSHGSESLSLDSPQAALKRKGFAVRVWTALPPPAELLEGMRACCQLWIISGASTTVTAKHIEVIQELVDLGKGLFLWGDNDPYNGDATAVLAGLRQTAGTSLSGNYHADQIIAESPGSGGGGGGGGRGGFSQHLVLTGIESLYEGITIAAVRGPAGVLAPLVRSSDGQTVTACYDAGGARVLVDGGFTRLYEDRWGRTAGTARFVTNAACWLYNYEGRVARAAAAATPGYKTQLCIHFAAGACKHGAKCSFAHGAAELQAGGGGKVAPPPAGQNLKTRLCKNFLAPGGCPFGAKCTFAHGPADLASPSAA